MEKRNLTTQELLDVYKYTNEVALGRKIQWSSMGGGWRVVDPDTHMTISTVCVGNAIGRAATTVVTEGNFATMDLWNIFMNHIPGDVVWTAIPVYNDHEETSYEDVKAVLASVIHTLENRLLEEAKTDNIGSTESIAVPTVKELIDA